MSLKFKCLGFIEDAYPGRTEENYFGTYSSIILLGQCNSRCAYCDVNGMNSTEDDQLPNARTATLADMKAFIEEQVRLNKPVVISGGEPTLTPELVVELAETIKAHGGYSILCTNGNNPDLSVEMSSHFNEVGVSIKGSRSNIERMTGRTVQDAWVNPITTIGRISSREIPVEVTLMVFNFSKASDFDEVIDNCNPSCYLIIKDYKAKTIAVDDGSYETVANNGTLWFEPPTEEQLFSIFNELRQRYPDLKDRIRLVMGDHGKNWIVTNSQKHYFERQK